MSNFDQALAYTLAIETDRYTNNPADRGGPTKFGITLASWSDYCGSPKTAEDVQGLSLELARAFYRHRHWLTMGLDGVNDAWVATILFDMSVNMGVAQAAKLAQRVAGAVVDGKIGPKSIAAINGMKPSVFAWQFFEQVQATYVLFAQQRADQVAWLPNWLWRSRKIIGPILMK